jgi:hypothetical protein
MSSPKSEDTTSTEPQAKPPPRRARTTTIVVTRVLSSKVSVRIPVEARSILIGAGGRNASLIGKYSQSFVQCSDEGEVILVPRTKDSDLGLGKRMVQAVVSGGILRWFLHAGQTNTFYHSAARAQLQALTASLTHDTCGLQLLRAHKGHLCLFIMPLNAGGEEEGNGAVYDLIRAARPVVLAKITELASAHSPLPTAAPAAESVPLTPECQ